MKAKVVTGFVPLEVKHLTQQQYKDFAGRMIKAIPNNIVVWDNFPFMDCWLAKWLLPHPYMPPASAVSPDRYPTPLHMVLSNVVQHQRTSWAMLAAEVEPSVDVWVWLDYAILKQGAWTGKPVEEKHIVELIAKIEAMDTMDDIPFPGIWDKGIPSDTGDNWRFCGSTHIWPTKFLPKIDEAYKRECLKFINRTKTIPLDLPVWQYVELTEPDLPFHFYPGNHDATQLTNFPGGTNGILTPHDAAMRVGQEARNG